MNPKVTLRMFIHPPDLGADLSHVGNSANRVNGSANAMANPSMPMAGPQKLPEVAKSTSRKPMMGPVQEKLTSANVNAIKKMERSPLVELAFESTLLVHLLGRVSSNHPKKLSANTTSSAQKKRLNTALVLRALSALAPKIAVMASPRVR